MAETETTDIRTLLGGGAGEDRLAVSHFVVGAVFLILGSLLSVLSLVALRFGDLIPVSFGRVEPMANLSLVIGFGVISLVGGVYYVLPRLTGARLSSTGLARLGLLGMAGIVTAGVVAIGFGFGSGRQPFGLPWWLDIPMLGTLSIPALTALRTIAVRTEPRSYVTVWFVIAGTVWMPLLFLANLVGHLPLLEAVQVAYVDMFVSGGMVTMVLLTLGTGLLYYAVVKELDAPLASRQLALVGLWSLGFASVWWGLAQLTFGPGPDWISGVVAALGLALPVAALANAANVSLTLEGSWGDLGTNHGVRAGVIGLYLAAIVAALAAVAGFRSAAAVTALTSFWEGIEIAWMAGVGALLVAATSLSALPRLVGREIHSGDRVRSFVRYTLVGSVGTLVTLATAGAVTGYSWTAGSNSAAYADFGEGWGAGVGATADTLLLLGALFAIVTLLGHLAYASVVLGTITSGKATTQELLVSKGVDDE
ncbi:MAG: cbb3-type cytochrome c oxidase subunit I [Acidimicrobiia bacterium]|nr:cbb3-type cytochrome c oxidase subunit I [Acidimicrobiia bacterium]